MRTEPNQTSCRASDNIKSTYLIDEVDDCLYWLICRDLILLMSMLFSIIKKKIKNSQDDTHTI